MKVLVTGAAGFIGYHTAKRLLDMGIRVIGLDNLNPYYDIDLKQARLNNLRPYEEFTFYELDLKDASDLKMMLKEHEFDIVIHLAAQAGVRYSIDHPRTYIESNVMGFMNILEFCKDNSIGHLIYASSSSVYGDNEKVPFSEKDRVDRPVSLYAATKKSNELMAHVYSKMYGLPVTGLRFFTVYGPYGRPDMAYYKFSEKMISGEPIDVYGNGQLSRDFTYIDDIVEGIVRLMDKPPLEKIPYHIFNIGYGNPVNLLHFIEMLENALGLKANKRMVGMQPGDVVLTYADVQELFDYIDYKPSVSFEEGIRKFVDWFRAYKGVKS